MYLSTACLPLTLIKFLLHILIEQQTRFLELEKRAKGQSPCRSLKENED